MSLVALILTKTDFTYDMLIPITTGSLAFVSFFNSLILSKKLQENGFLVGIIVGLILFIFLVAVSIHLGQFKFSAGLAIKLATLLFSGLLGGILGVNIN